MQPFLVLQTSRPLLREMNLLDAPEVQRLAGDYAVAATTMRRNPALGKLVQKTGMVYEGCMHQHVKKWSEYEDILIVPSLKFEYDALQKSGRV